VEEERRRRRKRRIRGACTTAVCVSTDVTANKQAPVARCPTHA
jgi:hypothetical protein